MGEGTRVDGGGVGKQEESGFRVAIFSDKLPGSVVSGVEEVDGRGFEVWEGVVGAVADDEHDRRLQLSSIWVWGTWKSS